MSTNLDKIIAKNKNGHGCYALKTTHGKALVELKRELNKTAVPKGIQLVTISRPNAYGEYALYHFVRDETEFICALCRGHERTGFIAGVNVGMRLQKEVENEIIS